MGTRTKLLITFALVSACASLTIPSIAATSTPSGVTIHHRGHHRLYGFVFSPNPRKCAKGRRVRIATQLGNRQNRRRDPTLENAMTHKASRGKYKWTLGQRGLRKRYYAVIKKRHGCDGDTSPTIKVHKHR